MTDISAILSGLHSSHTILSGLVCGIPAETMTRVRGEGIWSIAQHLNHLAFVQPLLAKRFKRMIEEDNPAFVPFIPSKGQANAAPTPIMDTEQSLAYFKTHRDEQLAILEAQPAAVWTRVATHPEYEQYGLHILARHVMMHDYWHLYRMEELWLARDEYLSVLPG